MKDGYAFDHDANVLAAIAIAAFLILSAAACVVWWLA